MMRHGLGPIVDLMIDVIFYIIFNIFVNIIYYAYVMDTILENKISNS